MTRRIATKKLRLERLESKRPLAADFTGSLLQAELIDGDLIITNLDQNFNIGNAPGNLEDQQLTLTGDNLGNIDILVEGAELFDPVSGDTLQPGDTLSLSGFTGGIDADFGSDLVGVAGNNTFLIRLEGGLDVGGDISVVGGADFVGLVIVGEGDFGDPAPFTIDGSISLAGSGPGTYGTAIVNGTVNGDITLDASQSDPQEDFTRGAFADFDRLTVAGDLSVDFGTTTIGSRFSAENRFTLDFSTVFGDVTFNGGDREDLVNLIGSVFDPVTIHGDFDIETQGGDDRIQINFSQFDEEPFATETFVSVGGELRVDDGDGEDLIQMTSFAVGERIDLRLGLGDDTVMISDGQITTTAIPADFHLVDAGGDDEIEITDFATGDDFRINLEGDADSLRLIDTTSPDDIRVTAGDGFVDARVEGGSVGDDVVFLLGDGDSDIDIRTLGVGHDVVVDTGGGEDIVFVNSDIVIGNDVRLYGGGDADELEVSTNSTVGGDVVLDGRGGDDALLIDGATIGGNAFLFGGRGDDAALYADATTQGDVLIAAGGGTNEVFTENQAAVVGDFILLTSGGDDFVELIELDVAGDLLIWTGAGNDTVVIETINVDNLFRLATQRGDDTVTITDATVDAAFVSLGAGDDSLSLEDVTIEDFGLLIGGRGFDTLEDLGGNDLSATFGVFDLAFEQELPAPPAA